MLLECLPSRICIEAPYKLVQLLFYLMSVHVLKAEMESRMEPSTSPDGTDTCRSHVRWETPRGRYDECSSKFSLREETKVIKPVGLGPTPVHNTTKKLCPNLTVRLSISPAC